MIISPPKSPPSTTSIVVLDDVNVRHYPALIAGDLDAGTTTTVPIHRLFQMVVNGAIDPSADHRHADLAGRRDLVLLGVQIVSRVLWFVEGTPGEWTHTS